MNAQPFPPLPIMAEHRYLIHFTVPAETRLAAIQEAVGMLRSGVHYIAVHSAEPTAGPYWDVVLKVWEEA